MLLDQSSIFIRTYRIIRGDIFPTSPLVYDFIYVDTDLISHHNIELWYLMLNKGGMICGRGFSFYNKFSRELLLAFKRKPDVITKDGVWIYKKFDSQGLEEVLLEIQEQEMEDEFLEFVRDKNVIFVGPSSILCGENRGEEINSYDLIIRTGNMLNSLDSDPSLEIDYGFRCDILYVNKLYEQTDCYKWWNISSWEERGLEFICRKLHTPFQFAGSVKYRNFNTDISNLNDGKSINPMMGVLLVNDILRFPIQSLYITGIDGFLPAQEEDRLSYSKGYIPDYVVKEEQLRTHPLPLNARVMLELEEDSRCTIDPLCRPSLVKTASMEVKSG